ncbi:hypothetical protein AALP_AA5G197500 [Arabis alpina]|uniref:NYN domain-containing protein n=1 Tax=Arabis alpina TaxID=50452 RepID=A0A087GY70_ARAAL|nr:hypothetical protein AALP_AA5G197500 [Arabis alpina]
MIGESNKAKLAVFWNMEDCPIPDDVDPSKIVGNIKSALASNGYDHGEVSVKFYSEKEEDWSFGESPGAEITYVPAGDQLTRFKRILDDIFSWAVINRLDRYRLTKHKVVLISKIPQDMTISSRLNTLNSRNFIVLLAVPDALAYVSSVWLWPCLTFRVNTIDHASKGNEFHVPKTGVFWNIDDRRPFSEGLLPPNVHQNIKSALKKNGYEGQVSISAYSDQYGSLQDIVFYFEQFGITLQNKVVKNANPDDSEEVDQMLVDILLWALDNPAPSNLLIISKVIPEETELLTLLRALESKDYNILFAQNEEAASADVLSKSIRNPIDQSGATRGVPNNANKEKECHEATTSVFWNMEQFPFPGCFDPLEFLELIKTSLATHGHDGKVSISAYCDKDRSLGNLSSTDIRFVPAGNISAISKQMFKDILFCALQNQKASNVMVITKTIPDNFYNVMLALDEREINVLFADAPGGYAKSVWLWPILAGGGKRIV